VVGVGVKVEVTAGVGVLVAVGGTVAVGVRVAVEVGVGGGVWVMVGNGVKVGASVAVDVGKAEGVAARINASFPLHPLSKSRKISRRHAVLIDRCDGAKRDRFILFIPIAVHYTPQGAEHCPYLRYSLVK